MTHLEHMIWIVSKKQNSKDTRINFWWSSHMRFYDQYSLRKTPHIKTDGESRSATVFNFRLFISISGPREAQLLRKNLSAIFISGALGVVSGLGSISTAICLVAADAVCWTPCHRCRPGEQCSALSLQHTLRVLSAWPSFSFQTTVLASNTLLERIDGLIFRGFISSRRLKIYINKYRDCVWNVFHPTVFCIGN